MGTNENEYTPRTEQAVSSLLGAIDWLTPQEHAGFMEDIDVIRADAKAEALEEAASAYPAMLRDMVSRPSVTRWLHDRAAQIREGL